MPNWLKDTVFYEIYPQSFYDTNGDGIGDINGITEKLDYIKGLGCNALWINPCFASPFRDAGYDVADYKQVAPRYGTNEDLIRCFAQAHKRGIKVLLDLVPGHTSDIHPWFAQSSKAEQNEYSHRYIWTDCVWNRPAEFGCQCGMWERDGCSVVNFFSSQPALNYGFNKITAPWQMPYTAPACRATLEAMKDVMRFWLDAGCDGFRVDMADSLVKNDDEKTATAQLWRSVRAMLDAEYPEAALVAEWSNPARAIVNAGFHMDFYLDHETNGYHALFRKTERDGAQRSFFSKQGKGDIEAFLQDYLPKLDVSKGKGYISFITCNHDTPRMTKAFTAEECKLAYAFIFTMPGVPFLYYGDEIGMQYQTLASVEGGYQRTGSRTPMQWADGDNLGFSTAPAEKLYLPVDSSPAAPTVAAQEGCPESLLETVRRVIALRHAHPCLQADGDFEVVYAEKNAYPFVYRRGNLLLAVNPAEKPVTVKLENSTAGDVLFLLGDATLADGTLTMGGQSFAVWG